MGYVGSLQPLVTEPGRIREAVGLEQRWKGSPVARVIGTGINEFVRGVDGVQNKSDAAELEMVIDGVSRVMERVKEREVAGLRRGTSILATISSSAPFVGLFGTTFGIITAFQQMSDPSKGGGGGIASVSAGIAEALMTTAVGLAVAIISVWFYNIFTGQIDAVTLDLDETAGEVVDTMMREGRNPVTLGTGGHVPGVPPVAGSPIPPAPGAV